MKNIIRNVLSGALPVVLSLLIVSGANTCIAQKVKSTVVNETPKIVNIVNFIRLLEPRDPAITEDVLYQTVIKQVEIMNKYNLSGTFLLQYDALMDSRYQKLLKPLAHGTFEMGAWWEIPQPLVEKAGLKWRGRYPWDWRANIGFSTGYTPKEREKLVDVYFSNFKKIFGYYPKSVGSWFIDSYSLNYMYQKYHIVASSNCKDQYGTDGYTLWGGYWNQAYYPSKINSYMPAQNAKNQIPVPIFRMLGSDPIRQYDNGLGTTRQGVVTLEPVYKFGGGDSTWVDWFFKVFTNEKALGFNYTQAGQENSFTWEAMAKGFELQMPLIARLRNEHKLKVETMAQSGRWFKMKYKLTPATSFTADTDIAGSNLKTVWFNSRFYRVNLLWENNTLRIRDIHLFNEQMPSVYTTKAATSNECQFFTLPLVDGYVWSKKGEVAGLRMKAVIGGKEVLVTGARPQFINTSAGSMRVVWPLTNIPGNLVINLDEKHFEMHMESKTNYHWFLDLSVANGVKLPFEKINISSINCQFEDMKYSIKSTKGIFSKSDVAVFRISAQSNSVSFDFSDIAASVK